ncbi:MAG: hypothetical protein ACRDZ3_09505 [Acidimicrobiia bacterium]
MHDLEAAIHEIGTRMNDCSAALVDTRAAAETNGAQVRAARGEQDRERSRANHWEAKAKEALEGLAAYESQAQTVAEDRDDDLRALRRAHQELAMTRANLAAVEAERDEARATLARAEAALSVSRAAEATAKAGLDGAEAMRLAAQKAQRMAESERDAAVGVLERRPVVVDMEIDIRTPAGIDASQDEVAEVANLPEAEIAPAATASRPRLLNVAATLGHLLPDNMDGLLVPGARVVRREGRLAALVAITGSTSGWAEATIRLEEKQAELLRSQGFRVEWLEGDRLAS